MFNLQQFLNNNKVTVTNLRTLLNNGVKTVKLFDEECDCFDEKTIDIAHALERIHEDDDGFTSIDGETHYWCDIDDSLYVGSSSYNVYFTAEQALILCLNYTSDWGDDGDEYIVTKKQILDGSYVSDEVELKRLHNTKITYTNWQDEVVSS